MTDVVNTGTAANSGNGAPLRQAFTLVNTRLQELLGTLTNGGVWVTATAYTATPTRHWVTNAGTAYVCLVNHTSGTFATDLAAGKWIAADVAQLISDLASTSAVKGAALVGSDDGAGGTLWTTVKGFITRITGANGAGMVGNTPAGSIAATTVQAAINELDSEKIGTGAVTSSGLTQATARVLGRVTASTGAIEELTAAQVAAFIAAASTTAQGAVELATVAEGKTGTDTSRAITSDVLHAAKSYLATLTATTSGTFIDFTSIPAWAKRITVMLNGVSTNGTSPPTIRIGDSGGIESSGYLGTTLSFANASPVGSVSSTTGFDLIPTHASGIVYHGAVTLTLMDAATNLWACSGVVNRSDAGAGGTLGYNKALSATLDRVRLTTNGGTDAFDAGSMNILIE